MFQPVPKPFNFPEAERRVLEYWDAKQVMRRSIAERRDGPKFVFYEGPPTANGLPHPGHVLTRVMKDLYPRYRTMCGYQCLRKGGWDTHGLPVEIEVCKELGIHTKRDIEAFGVEPFVRRCIDSVFRYIREWEEMTRRVAFWLDLEHAYVTYHISYVESVWWALKTLFDRGLLYQGHKVVWWWPQGGTALSAGEVGLGYRTVDDPAITVRFQLRDDPATSLLAWTTTPWTLPSNTAVAVHPDLEYSFVKQGDETFIVASELVEKTLAWRGEYIVTKRVRGRDLIGLKYRPLFDYAEPTGGRGFEVIPADFVTVEQGTGLAHEAPAFGEDDFRVASEQGIGMIQLIAPDGRFTPEAGEFAGRYCKDTDKDIIHNLKERGLIIRQETYRHEYPFCPRAEQDPLIQYARKCWFIRTTDFVKAMLGNNRCIGWLPEHIRDGRFGKFLESNVDWALSRERYWGTPLPIWVCEKTGHVEAVGSYAELLSKPDVRGTEAWKRTRAEQPDLPEDLQVHKPYIDAVHYRSPKDPTARMRRVPDVVDCWFDAGCMPFAQFGYPHMGKDMFREQFPADFISEAIDQTRGWFYSLLAISTMLFPEQAAAHPYKNCVVLGLVLGRDGKKLSKSLKNYDPPQQIFDREGADALRWYFYSAQTPWTSTRFDEAAIATSQREFLIRLYNVYSFFVIYANIDGFEPAKELPDPFRAKASSEKTTRRPVEHRSELDRWIIADLHDTIRFVRQRMDAYDNTAAAIRLSDFVDGLSNWYVRRSRHRFWKSEKDADKLDAYWTLYECLCDLSRLIAPLVPFFAETLWLNLLQGQFGQAVPDSVHLADYPQADESLIDEALLRQMALVRELVSLGRAARTDAKIRVRQPLDLVEIVLAEPRDADWLQTHTDLVAEELNVRRVALTGHAEEYVEYAVKPDFRSIGPKFGKLAPGIKKALAEADGGKLLAELRDKGHCNLTVAGQSVQLSEQDVQVSLSAKPGWAAAQGRRAVIILSIGLNDELRSEGMAREVVHGLQNIRKDLDLDYTARIEVALTGDAGVLAALRPHEEYIRRETLATTLTADVTLDAATRDLTLDAGQLQLHVRPVS
jgi:isoleucyl-tRNA synthetase